MCWTRSWIWVCEPCVVVRRTSFHLETRFHTAWKYLQTFVLVRFRCLKRAIDNRPWPPYYQWDLKSLLSKRELKQPQRRRQQERQKSNWLRLAKTTILHVHHAFLFISLPSLHDYDVKLPDLPFCGGREQKTTTICCFSWTLIQSFRI